MRPFSPPDWRTNSTRIGSPSGCHCERSCKTPGFHTSDPHPKHATFMQYLHDQEINPPLNVREPGINGTKKSILRSSRWRLSITSDEFSTS